MARCVWVLPTYHWRRDTNPISSTPRVQATRATRPPGGIGESGYVEVNEINCLERVLVVFSPASRRSTGEQRAVVAGPEFRTYDMATPTVAATVHTQRYTFLAFLEHGGTCATRHQQNQSKTASRLSNNPTYTGGKKLKMREKFELL